ncbi:MAG: ATP-binding protein [Thermodesulfobacteriota bacterium]
MIQAEGVHKILVVDDEPGIRRGCERVLRSQGHSVLLAESGEKGLELLRQQPDIDLVLVDLRMPGISGFDFLLQGQALVPETIFVMITAYATIESAVEATKRGAYDFIAKPFTPDDLLRLTNRALERVRLIRERNRLEAERRRRMLELVTEKSQFRTVIDCMTDGVIVCNADQTLVLYNPAAQKMFAGLHSLRTPLKAEAVLACQDLITMIAGASTGNKRLSNEIRLDSEGAPSWVLANVAPVIDLSSGRFLGTVTVLRDISEIKRIAQVKAQFMNMVAHELRAPLAAVDGYLAVIDGGFVRDDRKQHEIIQRSKGRIQALVDLVGDLLEMARMEEGTVRREITPQHLGEVFKEVAELMRPLADRSGVRLEVAAPDDLPPVPADREECMRIFGNLVSNAVKYNRQGGRVSIWAEPDGPYVKIAVADTGIGISREGQSRLFSEFFREKSGATSLITGTGLGLSIVKRIVDFYHGRIAVQSELDKGTTFTVWLPCQGPGAGARYQVSGVGEPGVEGQEKKQVEAQAEVEKES